jgi:hypothetical protein
MAFTFKLEQEEGTPADRPMLHTAVPNRAPRRHGDAVLVVEPT